MRTTVLVLTGVLVACTLLPLSRSTVWWVRGLEFPRLQFTVLSAGLAALAVVVLDAAEPSTWVAVAAAVSSFAYHAWWILPYTKLVPVKVPSSRTDVRARSLRILIANVLQTNRDSDAFLRVVRQNDPDVVVTLESDSWWESRLDELQEAYPRTIKCPLDNLYGMHVYSRLPLEDPCVEYLVEPDIPSMHALIRLPSGDGVRAHFIHPAPPSPTQNQESSERDAELIVVAKSVGSSTGPVVVTGDMNDVAWSRTTRLFQNLSGLVDPRVGRGMFNTFHARYPFVRWPLDHVFHTDDFSVRALKRLPPFGSDHFALYAELVYEGRPTAQPSEVSVDPEDERWADERARELGVGPEDVPEPGEGERG